MKRLLLFAAIAALMLGLAICSKDDSEHETDPIVTTKTIDLHLHLKKLEQISRSIRYCVKFQIFEAYRSNCRLF